MTFEDLALMLVRDYTARDLKSLFRAKASIKRLADAFAGEKAVNIKRDRLDAYVCDRMETGVKPATIRNELATLRRMFTLAEEARRLPRSQCPKFPTLGVRNARQGFFEERELRAVSGAPARVPAPGGPVRVPQRLA